MITMNINERIIQLHFEQTGNTVEISDVLLTIISKFQLFEPCQYLSEDDDWVNVSLVSIEDEKSSQAMSILKKEITAFGVFKKDDDEEITAPAVSQDLYQ